MGRRSGSLFTLVALVLGFLSVPPWAAAGAGFEPGHPQVRVTIGGGCPATVIGDQDVDNPDGPLTPLVPVGPEAGLVCRYGPRPLAPPVSGESTSALYRTTRLDRAAAGRLAAVIARLPTKAQAGFISCPADFGSVTIIAFSYRHRRDVDLWYDDSGCESLDNGHVRSFEPNNRRFYAVFVPLLDALSPSTPSAGS